VSVNILKNPSKQWSLEKKQETNESSAKEECKKLEPSVSWERKFFHDELRARYIDEAATSETGEYNAYHLRS